MSKLTFAFILFSVSAVVSAQTVLQTEVEASKNRWSGMAGVGYSSNLQEQNSYDSQGFLNGNLLLNYRLAGTNLLRTSLSGYQEQRHGQESKLNDGFVGWVNNSFWGQSKVLTVGQQLRGIFPSSKDSYKRDEKLLGVTLVPTFAVNLTPVGLLGVTLSYQPQFTKNFHKFEQNRLYQSNTEFSAIQVLAISWSIADKLYLQPSLAYVQSWSYGGVKKDDAYEFTSEFGYKITPHYIIAAGITNAGAIRNLEHGNDQTLELFNDRTASVYTQLTYAF